QWCEPSVAPPRREQFVHRRSPRVTKYLLRRFVSYTILTALATAFAYIAASSFFRPRNRYEGNQPPIPESSIDEILSGYGTNHKDPVLLRTWEWRGGLGPPPLPDKLDHGS